MAEICILIPCYNETKRIDQTSFIEFIEQNPNYALCFVNDGSTDGTWNTLLDLEKKGNGSIKAIDNPHNMGKAETVRTNIPKALAWQPFKYIAYFDADLATPLDQCRLLLKPLLKNDQLEMAMACRFNRLGAHVKRKWFRHILGRVFATVASNMLNLNVYDTQCGAKLFRRDIALSIFTEEPFISRWLFDIEVIRRIQNLGFNAEKVIVEIPVERWEDIDGSTLKPYDFIKAPLELLQIYLHYR